MAEAQEQTDSKTSRPLWEYRVEHLFAEKLTEVGDALTAAGADGWECFHVETLPTQVRSTSAVALFFKRPV